MRDQGSAPILLIMGVSGSGKSTIGALLAGRLQWPYAEADDFHPAENLRKMRAGKPLTDEDRLPWLQAIGAWIDEQAAAGRPAVVSCSALKRSYREVLRGPAAGPHRFQLQLIYLEGDREMIARRMAARHGHFFPESLLDSQFRDLEPPGPDEHAIVVRVGDTPQDITDEIISKLGLTAPGGAAPRSTGPGGAAPGGAAPGGIAPGGTAQGRAAPGDPAPGGTGPGGTAPGSAGPGGTAQGRTAPGDPASGGAVPGDLAPGNTDPGGTAPGERAPGG